MIQKKILNDLNYLKTSFLTKMLKLFKKSFSISKRSIYASAQLYNVTLSLVV